MESLRLVDGTVESHSEKRRRPPHQLPHWLRITFRVFSTALCIAIVVILIHTILLFNSSKDERFTYPKGIVLPAWPQNLKMYPTNVMLASSIIAAMLNITALIALFGYVGVNPLPTLLLCEFL